MSCIQSNHESDMIIDRDGKIGVVVRNSFYKA